MSTGMAGGLEVFVLGPLLVQHDGRPVELGPLRRRATLAALLVDANHVVAQDTLVDRVWDGEPPDAAVAAVQAYLSRLRSALKRAGAGDETRSPIVTAHPGYRLEIAPGNLDAERFAAAVTAGRAAREAGDLAGAAREVRAGLALWRGDAYLDVPTLAARREAERWAGLRRSAHELAIDLDLALGRHDDVLDELRDLVAATPLAEQVHALFMLALHRAGRPAEALDHFARVRATLGDELGVDPGRDLQELHARILRSDPGLDLATVPATRRAAPSPAAAPPVPTTLDTTADAPRLIGRVPEAGVLREALDAAVTSGFRAVAVVGEAGIGKTRLLEEGAAHARSRGAAVVWGRSWQHDGAPRMWPFAQALRALAAEIDPGVFAEAARPHAAALAAVVPELVDDLVTGSLDPASADLEGSELRLLDAVARVLARIGEQQPVVVVLEDMHWADATSRRTAEYLVTQLTAPGVALVVSVRWPSDEASAATGALLAGLARGQLVRIDLAGFGADDIRAYVADRTGAVLDERTTAALLERTDGNPFFVGEIVRLVVTDSGLASESAADARVPESVRAVVLARLERLDPDDRAVLDAAAVVGRSFDLDLLVAASGRAEDVVDEAVDRATAAGVIATEPGHPGVHRFSHALVQQTLLESLGPSRRRRVHARVAAELGRREFAPGVPRDPDLLVHHLAGAGGDADLVRAVDICVARSDAARARADLADAEAVLLQAIDLAARLHGPDAPLAEMSARLRLYALYILVSPSSELARAQHARAVQLAREYGRPGDLLMAMQAAYSVAIIRFDVPAMVAVEHEQAVAAEAMDDDGLRLGALMNRTARLFYTGRIAAALSSAEETIALLDRPGFTVLAEAYPIHPARCARWYRAASLTMVGRDEEALTQAAELDSVVDGRDPHTTTYINLLVAMLHALRGDPDGASEAVRRTRVAQQVGGITDGAIYLDVIAAWVEGRRRPGEEPGVIGDLLAAYDHVPTLGTRPLLRGLQADVLLLAGRWSDAVVAARRGLEEIDRTGEQLFEPWLARLGSLAASRTGDDALADRWRARSFAVAAQTGLPVATDDREWKFLTAAHLDRG